MNFIKYIFCLFSFTILSQEQLNVTLIKKVPVDSQNLVYIDNFNTNYHLNNNTLITQKGNRSNQYSNLQLGEITSVNAFNPLKLNLFYKGFNTVVILDNRLAEITKINFNTILPFRDITHISTGNDNTFWVFNQNSRQLELFDYINRKTRAVTLPIEGSILNVFSNYNFCWVLTENFIYSYNYFGSLVSKKPNNGFISLKENRENIYLLKGNKLFFKEKDKEEIVEIKLPKLLIKQFFVTNETLYIYDDIFLYHYQLITP